MVYLFKALDLVVGGNSRSLTDTHCGIWKTERTGHTFGVLPLIFKKLPVMPVKTNFVTAIATLAAMAPQLAILDSAMSGRMGKQLDRLPVPVQSVER
jgi:hypothetical protein